MREEIVFETRDLRINALQDNGSELPIVKDVTFQVPRGKVVALIGESGSGKTTISLAALGYCKPGLKFAGGEVNFLGQDLTKLPMEMLRAIRGERVAYLTQSAAAAFNPALRINDQVTEAAVQHGKMTKAEADARALDLYRALELPDPGSIGRRYPHQVSGGQLQRLMAAAALCSRPDLLVLDEPTTALDVTTQIEVLNSFKKVIRDEGAAAIYVTHDLAVVAQIADYVVVLYRGEVQEMGPIDAIVKDPQHPYTKRLMAAVRPPPGARAAEDQACEPSQAIPALEVREIWAGYGKSNDKRPLVPVLKDVDLTIEQGRTIGIIGESGSGKSTLARVIAGLLPPSTGEIFLHGKPIEGAYRKRRNDELRKIQLVYQMADTALNPKHTVGQIIGRAVELSSKLRGAEKRARVDEMLRQVDLRPEFAKRYPEELSGGQKQRINLARALAAEPEVMLCDEVTSALDTIVGANIVELLRRLKRETNVSFAFISHDLSTVASFADAIVVLYAGRIVERGPTEKVLSPPYHPYTRLLIASVPEMRVGWLEETMATRETLKGGSRGAPVMSSGCPFYDRCPLAIEGTCNVIEPPRRSLPTGNGHYIACHRDISNLGA